MMILEIDKPIFPLITFVERVKQSSSPQSLLKESRERPGRGK